MASPNGLATASKEPAPSVLLPCRSIDSRSGAFFKLPNKVSSLRRFDGVKNRDWLFDIKM